MLRDHLLGILEGYVHARTSTPFGKDNLTAQHFAAIREQFIASAAVQNHPTLKVVASYGKGNWTAVPWISFLDTRETTTTQNGVYPVILFADDMSGFSLNLSQGVTEIINEYGNAKGKTVMAERAAELRKFCAPLKTRGFVLESPDKKLGKEYEAATAAYKYYPANAVPADDELLEDLAAMLTAYDDYLTEKKSEAPTPLCLLGTGKSAMRYQQDRIAKVKSNGFYVSPWTFSIREEIKPRLKLPFYLYVNTGSASLPIRYRVADYKTVSGSTGIATPWPEFTDPEFQNQTGRGENAWEQWKTWFKIDAVETLSPPLTLADFEPVAPSQQSSLLNQSTFGYARPLNEPTPAPAQILTPTATYQVPPQPTPFSFDDALDGLFIEPDTFTEMVNALTQKKNVILQGAPGVGKTFVAKRLAYTVIGEHAQDRVEMIQFHQSYAYEDFIQGYRPTGHGFDLRNGVFHDFCVRAAQDPTRKYVFVIDEINRGNLSKIFGELMMLIEPDKRGLEWGIYLTYQDRAKPRFYVPENVHLLGLMNTADRSIAMVDYALRRRFAFIDVEPGFATAAFRGHLTNAGASTALIDKVVSRMQQLNTKIAADKTNLGPGFRIGHSFFCTSFSAPDENWYQRVIQTEIAPLIREYWFDDTEQADAEVKQLLSV